MPDVTGIVINKTGCKAGTTAKGQIYLSAHKISPLQGLAIKISLPFCRCASLASSFVYYNTSDIWHVHPCTRDPASTSPFDLCVMCPDL